MNALVDFRKVIVAKNISEIALSAPAVKGGFTGRYVGKLNLSVRVEFQTTKEKRSTSRKCVKKAL